MTVLPQLQDALVGAATKPPQRTTQLLRASAPVAIMLVVLGVVVLLTPHRGDERISPGALATVPEQTLLKARDLASSPGPAASESSSQLNLDPPIGWVVLSGAVERVTS